MRWLALLAFVMLLWVSGIPLPDRVEGAPRDRKRDAGEKKKDASPDELWRLYPLNPEAGKAPSGESGGAPAATPTPTPSPTARGEVPGATGSPGADRDWTPWLVGLGAGGALSIVGLLLLRRRAAPGSLTPDVSARAAAVADAGASPPQTPVADAAEPAGVRGPVPSTSPTGLVRVHLRDGRWIEGRVRGTAARDGRVLLIDADTVYDRAGNELEVRSVDSFVPDSIIESVEHLAERGVRN